MQLYTDTHLFKNFECLISKVSVILPFNFSGNRFHELSN